MGQRFLEDSIGSVDKVSVTSIQLTASRITIGGQQYTNTAAIIANLASVGFNGLDMGALTLNTLYYVYAVINGGALGIVASTNSSAPTGFAQSKLVGRFNTNGSSQVDAVYRAVSDDGKVGHTMSAHLTEAQFQAVHGPGWILSDGRNVVGSKYHSLTGNTTVPDARGRAIIGAGQGSGLTNRALGSSVGNETHAITGAELPGHQHQSPLGQAVGSIWGKDVGGFQNNAGGGGVIQIVGGSFGGGGSGAVDMALTSTSVLPGTGTAHNIMQPSVALNHFIKIN